MDRENQFSRAQLMLIASVWVTFVIKNIQRLFEVGDRTPDGQCVLHCNGCGVPLTGIMEIIWHLTNAQHIERYLQPHHYLGVGAHDNIPLIGRSLLTRFLAPETAIGLFHVAEVMHNDRRSSFECFLCGETGNSRTPEHLLSGKHIRRYIRQNFRAIMTEYRQNHVFNHNQDFKAKISYHASLIIARRFSYETQLRINQTDFKKLRPEIVETYGNQSFIGPADLTKISNELRQSFGTIFRDFRLLQFISRVCRKLTYFPMEIETIADELLTLSRDADNALENRRNDCSQMTHNINNLAVLETARLILIISYNNGAIRGWRVGFGRQIIEDIDEIIGDIIGRDESQDRKIFNAIVQAYAERGYFEFDYAEIMAFVSQYREALEIERMRQPAPPGDDQWLWDQDDLPPIPTARVEQIFIDQF